MKTIKGRTAFLTGAASGIGRSLATALAAEGCHLYLVDVDENGLRSLEQELASSHVRVWTRTCDLANRAALSQVIPECLAATGGIDLLINNAGVAYYGPTDQMTQKQWDWLMSINLLAPIQITHELLPSMLRRPDSHIVNMCSISGLVAGGRFAAYHTSKYGLIGFTESLRAEYGRHGVGVTAICPGPVTTKLYASAASGRPGKPVPSPPNWLCTTPDRVAAITLKAIRRDRRQVLITPTAHFLFQMKRFAPWLIDFVNRFSTSRLKRKFLAKSPSQPVPVVVVAPAAETQSNRAA
ncbi:MAG: SDR family oxidoreductase [Planctomycetota bacterium]|nr:MAG: SDR family oxidoreductase [Planctomycetota bacterium]